jgi:excisionase family DNA binding protein
MIVTAEQIRAMAAATPDDEPTDVSDLLTPTEVGDLFHVHPKTVTGWAAAGAFPSIRTPGNRYRFRRADVAAALKASEVEP